MGRPRPSEGGPGPGSDMSRGRARVNTQVSPPVGTSGEAGLQAFLPFQGPAWRLRRVPWGRPEEVRLGAGGGLLLTKSLILRQKIGHVVIYVLDGDGEAS